MCRRRASPAIRPALWVFTWNNSTAAVGREFGPGRRGSERVKERGESSEREREGRTHKMDMANLFKHFFRELPNFFYFLELSVVAPQLF